MTAGTKSDLSLTQQTMLDLALACDLQVSDASRHEAIRSRHKAILRQQDAANYIREVENKIHSRRKFPIHPKMVSAQPPKSSGDAR